MTTAVLLAAGSGERFSREVPKQLLKVAGVTVLEHSLRAFESHELIDQIVVVTRADLIQDVRAIISNKYPKVIKVVQGGERRSDSSLAAIKAIDRDDSEKVLLHDAVRPLVTHAIITESIRGLDVYEAIDVAIPASDTIIETSDGVITSIPNRENLRRGQTPQGFRLGVLRKAYSLLEGDGTLMPTDDCGVVLHYLPEVSIGVVEGSETNIKLTYPIDSYLADRLFQLRSGQAEIQNDTNLKGFFKGKRMVIFGGSYGIGASISEMAESLGAQVENFSRSKTETNVKNSSDVERALQEVNNKYGAIDFVINTAGLLKISRIDSLTDADVEDLIGVNYLGAVNVARASYKYLKESNGGLLLFTSSSYTRGRAEYSLYSSSKAAVVNLVQALSEEWIDYGVSINCVNPERTQTPMRTENFGIEDPSTLLGAETVAVSSLNILYSDLTGCVYDVRR